MKKAEKVLKIVTIILVLITLVAVLGWQINMNLRKQYYDTYNNASKQYYDDIISKNEYNKIRNEYWKYGDSEDNFFVGSIISGAITILSVVVLTLLIIRDKKGIEVFYKVLLGIGIAIVVIGIIVGIIVGIVEFIEDGMLIALICSAIGSWFIFGYITHRMLPKTAGSFAIGFFLGIIGIIIAICMKTKENNSNTVNNNSNKYEDLQKLQKLKEDGILTQTEFEVEKAKLLR